MIIYNLTVRFLFKENTFYRFTKLAQERYVYITKIDSLPGWQERSSEQAVGRSLATSWFERDPALDTGLGDGSFVVRPVAKTDSSLGVMNQTVAEIARAAGAIAPSPSNASARDLEFALEKEVLTCGVTRYESRHFHEDPTVKWAYVLTNSCAGIEQEFYDTTEIEDMTKMAIARSLQLRDGLSDDSRDKLWRLDWEALAAGLWAPPAVVHAAVASAPKIAAKALAKHGAGLRKRLRKRPAAAG